MSLRTGSCGCEGEECICHFYHYDCACEQCPECAEDCFCFNPEDAMEHQADAQELFDNGMWMSLNEMGERPEIDPFADDTPIECGLENPDICESCQ